jgi:toxin-antitoxin system PIN domain toxin
MLLTDVNVLVYAHRADAAGREAYRAWLEDVVNGEAAFGMADLVLSGFVRVVTHPKVFHDPSPVGRALDSVMQLRYSPNRVVLAPGGLHWDIFAGLVRATGARGNLIPDAYLAALAIEHGADWVTTDRDYSRFPALRWRHPLRAAR